MMSKQQTNLHHFIMPNYYEKAQEQYVPDQGFLNISQLHTHSIAASVQRHKVLYRPVHSNRSISYQSLSLRQPHRLRWLSS